MGINLQSTVWKPRQGKLKFTTQYHKPGNACLSLT
jgi:hypothetical protein